MFVSDEERQGSALIEKLRVEVLRAGKAAGLKRTERTTYTAITSAHAEVSFGFGGSARHRDYKIVTIKVETLQIFTRFRPRPVTFRIDVEKATPEVIAERVQKIIEKAREFNELGASRKVYEKDAQQRKREEARMIRDVVRTQFSDYKETGAGQYNRKAKGESGGYESGVELIAGVTGGEDDRRVYFQMRIDRHLSPEEAREIADVLARQKAARKPETGEEGDED
jgi:hypothetical protein